MSKSMTPRPGRTTPPPATGPAREAPPEHQHESARHPLAWRVVALLALANVLNFYDRTLPSIVAEPIRVEFGLSDTQLGLLASSFTCTYAIAGIILGRIADRRSRRKVMAGGLVAWSLLTAATGGAWSFASLLLIRLGVGIGEASYAPAANATIADLFPSDKRSRATAVFQLGLPFGLILAFFTTAPIVEAFDSWRAPFLIAAVPGFVVALLMLRIPAVERQYAEPGTDSHPHALRSVLKVRTIWWLAIGGIGLQIISYSLGTFLVPLLMRYFALSLSEAAVGAGVVMGVAGLIGLLLGGPIADRARRRSSGARLGVGVLAAIGSCPLAVVAFTQPPTSPVLFVALLSLAVMLSNFFHTTALPAISEVVTPQCRATAIAVFFAAFYLLGGAFGPLLAGALSERLTASATPRDGLPLDAIGLHDSLMWILPLSCVVLALGTFMASRTINADAAHAREAGSRSTVC